MDYISGIFVCLECCNFHQNLKGWTFFRSSLFLFSSFSSNKKLQPFLENKGHIAFYIETGIASWSNVWFHNTAAKAFKLGCIFAMISIICLVDKIKLSGWLIWSLRWVFSISEIAICQCLSQGGSSEKII